MKSKNPIGKDTELNKNTEVQLMRLTKENGHYIIQSIPNDDPFFKETIIIEENGLVFGEPHYDICPGLRIECEWDNSMIPLLEEYSIKYLVLNSSYGWRCKDYSFLSRIPLMKSLYVLSSSLIHINHIEHQTELEELVLHGHIIDSLPIDFGRFKKIKRLSCSGSEVNDSLFSCSTLTYLWIDELWKKEAFPIGRLIHLKELTIKNSSLSDIEFLNYLPELTKLSLDNCRSIRDYGSILYHGQIRWLSLRGVIIRDLGFLRNMPELRILVIETGNVRSIKPVKDLNKLRAFSLSATVMDHDLTPLLELPLLSMLWINNKRDYPYHINNHWDWDEYGVIRQGWLSEKSKQV